MPFVDGVRWTFRGKDAGRPDSGCYRGNRGRSIGASSAARRHNLYFAKPSYYEKGQRKASSPSRR